MLALVSRSWWIQSLHHCLCLLQQIHELLAGEAVECLQILRFGQPSEICLPLAQGQAGPEACKNSCKCCFVQFWAQFPWAFCLYNTHRAFWEGLGTICIALSSLLLLRSASFLDVDGYQQHLKRWRKGNASFRRLSPGYWTSVRKGTHHCSNFGDAMRCCL